MSQHSGIGSGLDRGLDSDQDRLNSLNLFGLRAAISAACIALVLSACGGGGGSGGDTPVFNNPPAPPPSGPPAVSTTPAFSNLSFSAPVALRQAPADNSSWYLVEQAGRILRFDNDESTTTSTVFLDITARVRNNTSETGLLSMAFHPNFPAMPQVYVFYTTNGALRSRIAEYRLNAAADALDPGTETVLIEVPQPQTNHNGGDLAFDQQGNLLISFGDGGGAGDPGENAQNTNNLLGTVVRIDVDGPAPYGIPTDNPFASTASCQLAAGSEPCAEIYAWGLRNPWRMTVDTVSGNVWLADVGQNDWEEVNRIELGSNYGWNDREGANCFDPPSNCADTFAEPVAQYPHSEGQSITGGYVYRGTEISGLSGFYVYGDFVSGRLFATSVDAQPTETAIEIDDTDFNISTFGQDQSGELILVDYNNGSLHRLTPAP